MASDAETEPGAHLADHARAELVHIETLTPVAFEPEPFVACFVASENGGIAERAARDQILDPRARGVARVRLVALAASPCAGSKNPLPNGPVPSTPLPPSTCPIDHVGRRTAKPARAVRGPPDPGGRPPRPRRGRQTETTKSARSRPALRQPIEPAQQAHGAPRQPPQEPPPARDHPADRDTERMVEIERRAAHRRSVGKRALEGVLDRDRGVPELTGGVSRSSQPSAAAAGRDRGTRLTTGAEARG